MLSFFAPLALAAALGAGQIEFEPITFTSSLDQTEQPANLYAAPESGPQPLLVLLHWWSTDSARYNPDAWVAAARVHGWHVAVPNFRGPNTSPEACASPAARRDVLDTVAAVKAMVPVDPERIYLAGVSGGGHMSMVMAAWHPESFAAISAWAGISDLAAWHRETKDAGMGYWRDIEASTGGAPGSSAEVDREYRARSPLPHLGKAVRVPLDLNTGIHDGHDGSVPIHHTLDAFNAIATAQSLPGVPQSRINALSQELTAPDLTLNAGDYERPIYLRAEAGLARVTIFEGGHEGLPTTACAWLATHSGGKE